MRSEEPEVARTWSAAEEEVVEDVEAFWAL